MKRVWIVDIDGLEAFSNTKKAYDASKIYRPEIHSYRTVLKHLKDEGSYMFETENSNQAIRIHVLKIK